VLQVDGYAGYNRQPDAGRIGGPLTVAYCWSHFLRRLYDIAKSGTAPIAEAALARIRSHYAIDGEIRGHPADERRV
jgi:hypothetical protein